jgi:hypothetical protein
MIKLPRAGFGSTKKCAVQSGAWTMVVRDTITGFRITAHHTLMMTGITAIAALAVMFIKPDLTEHVKALSPFSGGTPQLAGSVRPQGLSLQPAAGLAQPAAQAAQEGIQPAHAATQPVPPMAMSQAGASQIDIGLAPKSGTAKKEGSKDKDAQRGARLPHEQKWVTEWLAKRYRVAGDAANMLVSATYSTARELKFDPLLILAVMAIESGLNPFAESPMGAQGLMQVMSKIHHEKFQPLGGLQQALNPVANIKVGSMILKDYVQRGGSVEAGLKMYVGAGAFESDSGYGYKVLAEYRRLKDVASGKSVSAITAPAKPQPKQRLIEARSEEEKPAPEPEIKENDTIAAL